LAWETEVFGENLSQCRFAIYYVDGNIFYVSKIRKQNKHSRDEMLRNTSRLSIRKELKMNSVQNVID
jgi:hypothetical protein